MFLLAIKDDVTYPKTLPTLRPPNTNDTARDRSSNGINLHKSNKQIRLIKMAK